MKVYFEYLFKKSLKKLRFVGLHPTDGSVLNPYTIYSIVVIGWYTLHLIAHSTYVLNQINDLAVFTSVASITVMEVFTLGKAYLIFNNFDFIKGLMDKADCDIFQAKSTNQIEIASYMMNAWTIFYKGYFICAIGTIVLFSFVPFLDGSAKLYKLGFEVWIPFDYKKPIVYEIVLLHQGVSYFLMALTQFTVDTVLYAYMVVIAIQCELLADKLENLHVLGSENEPQKDEDVLSANLDINLRHCIRHHKAIIQ